MSEPTYSPPDNDGKMRKIGTSEPDGDTLNFTLSDNPGTVLVDGVLKTDATLDTTSNNPGRSSKVGAVAELLANLHEVMVTRKRPCNIRIEFTFHDDKEHRRVTWNCNAKAH